MQSKSCPSAMATVEAGWIITHIPQSFMGPGKTRNQKIQPPNKSGFLFLFLFHLGSPEPVDEKSWIGCRYYFNCYLKWLILYLSYILSEKQCGSSLSSLYRVLGRPLFSVWQPVCGAGGLKVSGGGGKNGFLS